MARVLGSAACPLVAGVVMAMGAVPVVRPGRCLILMDRPSGLMVRPSLIFSSIVEVVDEVEALQQHAEDEHRFLHGELAADAGPLTRSERFERVRRKLRPGLGPEVVGVELLGVGAPHGSGRGAA